MLNRWQAGHQYTMRSDSFRQTRSALTNRDIAQSGSAPALGAGCREFESLYPDQLIDYKYERRDKRTF